MLKEEHLKKLAAPYGIDLQQLEFLQCSQNYVYKAQLKNNCVIVRVSWGRHRDQKQVDAELKWIDHLTKNGIRACRPICSNEGKLSHSIEIAGKTAIVTIFEYAPGRQVERKFANESTFESLGRLTGTMHAAAFELNQAGGVIERPSWTDSRLLKQDLEACRQALSDSFATSVEEMVGRISRIPKRPESFGIVHGDINFANIFEDGQKFWIFDFDNCEYGYFVQELATVLWDSIYCKELREFADSGLNRRIELLWEAFLRGYSETSPLKEINLNQLKDFFLLRESIIYVHFHRTLELSKISESFRRGLEVMRRNVEEQDHQVDIALISKNQRYIKTVLTTATSAA